MNTLTQYLTNFLQKKLGRKILIMKKIFLMWTVDKILNAPLQRPNEALPARSIGQDITLITSFCTGISLN